MKLKTFVLLFALLITPLAARADEGEDIDRRVRILLYRHHGPPDALEFERLVPGAKTRLFTLANDHRTDFMLRDRALVALASFGGDDVRLLYERVLAEPMARVTTRAKVLAAYARVYPQMARPVLEKARLSEERPIRAVAEAQLKAR
jgi:hypothetical protein